LGGAIVIEPVDRDVGASGSKFQRHRAADPLLLPVTKTTLPANCMFRFP
jgi:hypothetical protein